MSCKPQAKSLRAANGVELMTRFAKRGGSIRAVDGLESLGNGVQDQFGSGQKPGAPMASGISADSRAAARAMPTGGFNMAMPTGLALRDGGEGGLVTGGHRGLFDSASSLLDDWGITTPEHVAGTPTTWSGGARAAYQRPQVTMAPVAPPAAPAPVAPPAAPSYPQRQGFTTPTPQLRAYTTAAPGTASAQNDANAWAGTTPLKAPTHQESNAAFSPAAPNGLRYSANQFGDAAAQKEWSTPGRSTGRPNAQDMVAAGGFAQRDAAKLAQVKSSGSFIQPAQTSTAPYSGPVSGLPGAPGSFKANTAGLRRGGELQTGHGGVVPGKGKGDKIPAKYEPGEFVVSNDMLRADPGLRGELRSLRKRVLAAKGMTPEQADAKAMNNGKGIRAQLSLGDTYLGGGSPEDKAAALRGAYAARSGAPDPRVMTQGVDGVAGPGQKYPGRAVVPQGVTPQMSDARGVATTADAGRGFSAGPTNLGRDAGTINMGSDGNATRGRFAMVAQPADPRVVDVDSRVVPEAAPKTMRPMGPNAGPPRPPGGYRAGQALAKVARVAPVLAGGYELASGMDEGDGWKMAKGVGDMAAGAALATPLAPAAGAYLGLRGAYEGAKALAPVVSDYFMKRNHPDMFPSENKPAAPAAAPAAPQNFEAANAAKLAAFAASEKAEAPKLGDLRNVDPEAGTQDVFTQGVWRTVSTPEAKAQRLRDAADWKQEQADNAVQHRADMDRQVAYFEKQNAGGDKYANMPIKTAAAMRVADAQAASQMAQAQLQANTSLRTTGMNNETQLMGNKMTNAFNMRKFQVEQGNKNREYELDVAKYGTDTADKNRAASESSAKAMNERMERMWRTNVDGKDVPDTAKIGRYTQNVQATMPDFIARLLKENTPAARAKAEDIKVRGAAALNDADHELLRTLQLRQDRLEGTHGAVIGSTHKKSASLLGYDQMPGTTAKDGSYYLANKSVVPARHMLYNEPGNDVWPDWFKRKDDTLTRGLRAE